MKLTPSLWLLSLENRSRRGQQGKDRSILLHKHHLVRRYAGLEGEFRSFWNSKLYSLGKALYCPLKGGGEWAPEPVKTLWQWAKSLCLQKIQPWLSGLSSRRIVSIPSELGTAVAQWLRCCATNRKVAGSIPDGVIGNFNWHNPSGYTMAPGVDSASNRNEYQEHFLGVKEQIEVRKSLL